MDFNINGITISEKEMDEYYDRVINELFKILGIYESCEKDKDFYRYVAYLEKLIPQLSGSYEIFGTTVFITLVSTLNGMLDYESLTHKKIKSLVFHCIDLVSKTKVVG